MNKDLDLFRGLFIFHGKQKQNGGSLLILSRYDMIRSLQTI